MKSTHTPIHTNVKNIEHVKAFIGQIRNSVCQTGFCLKYKRV